MSKFSKLYVIFGIMGMAAILVSLVSLIILIIYLDVKPGHRHLVSSNQKVNTLKLLIWCFGLLGGGLTGWATALRTRYRVGLNVPISRKLILLIPGALLILWSIERAILGIAPISSRIILTPIGVTVSKGPWYDFSAVIAAVILVITATLGGFIIARGLTPMPRNKKDK